MCAVEYFGTLTTWIDLRTFWIEIIIEWSLPHVALTVLMRCANAQPLQYNNPALIYIYIRGRDCYIAKAARLRLRGYIVLNEVDGLRAQRLY